MNDSAAPAGMPRARASDLRDLVMVLMSNDSIM